MSAINRPANTAGVVTASETTPSDHIFRFLDTVGDGTGTKNAIGNYAAATDFKLSPAAGEVYVIERLIVSIRDSSDLKDGKYGNAIVLANGITVSKKNASGVLIDITDGVPIIESRDWGRNCYDFDAAEKVGKKHGLIRWTFGRSGRPLTMSGDAGEFLAVTLQDNLSASTLVEHYFKIDGFVV